MPSSAHPSCGAPREKKALQAAAVLAAGAAAVALVAGIGTYLRIRFTQHRGKPPGAGEPPPGPRDQPGH